MGISDLHCTVAVPCHRGHYVGDLEAIKTRVTKMTEPEFADVAAKMGLGKVGGPREGLR